MSIEIDYETLADAKARCSHCGQLVGLENVDTTHDAGVFGHTERKIRLVRCPHCDKESQFASER